MCVICDQENRVISVSLIPGLGLIPEGYKVYFPWCGEIPAMNEILSEKQIKDNS
jgi:hypothetical protein